MSTFAKYSIKDLEVLSNIKSHTIRIWEKRYGILIPERTDTNIRHYTNDDLKKLLNISFLNRHGFKISKIAQMPEEEINQKVLALNLLHSNDNSLIESLIVAMIELNEAYFQKVLNVAIVRFGFEQAVTDIVFSFFHRIGIMWQTGVINPAQEHFVSNIIRQKIIAATDALDYKPQEKLSKIVLFLPENEMHEISLLLYNYALRYRGYPTVYLGQAVPIDSLERIVEITRPDVLVCSLVNALNAVDIKGIFQKMSKAFAGEIFISGSAVRQYKRKMPNNIRLFDHLDDLLVHLHLIHK